MNRRDLFWFLGLEVFAIVWAGVVFSLIASRLVAGALAGLYFVGFAALMLRWIWRWPKPWRSLTLYPLLIHLFGVALPMVTMRFLHADLPFDQIQIWSLSGPEFHQLSGYVFTALMAATVVDLVRTRFA